MKPPFSGPIRLVAGTRTSLKWIAAVSQHLSVLENAGLIVSAKRGQFVVYRLLPDALTNVLNGYVQEVCPVSRPLKAESRALADRQRQEGDAD